MDTILDALQEGRLIELPDNEKKHALQFLAHILEAIPSIPTGTDVVGMVMAREITTNTALGKGWACPHARVPFEEDLMCVVGWSPVGIDYGAADGVPVSIIVMHLVPPNQRNHYLREVSILAKALNAYPGIDKMRSARELNDVRDYLLDLISATKETVGPETRARMIQLQAKPSAEILPSPDLSNLIVEPLTIIAGPGHKPIVLAQNINLIEILDSSPGLIEAVSARGIFQNGGWRIIKRGSTTYLQDRVVYECLAIKAKNGNSKQAR